MIIACVNELCNVCSGAALQSLKCREQGMNENNNHSTVNVLLTLKDLDSRQWLIMALFFHCLITFESFILSICFKRSCKAEFLNFSEALILIWRSGALSTHVVSWANWRWLFSQMFSRSLTFASMSSVMI